LTSIVAVHYCLETFGKSYVVVLERFVVVVAPLLSTQWSKAWLNPSSRSTIAVAQKKQGIAAHYISVHFQ
jgi:hypothetical protein